MTKFSRKCFRTTFLFGLLTQNTIKALIVATVKMTQKITRGHLLIGRSCNMLYIICPLSPRHGRLSKTNSTFTLGSVLGWAFQQRL